MTDEKAIESSPAESAAVVPAPAPASRRATLEMLEMLRDQGQQQEFIRRLVEREVARDIFDQDYRLARVFAMSGQFDSLKNQTMEQGIASAMARIQLGRSWDLEPADAMQFVYFTNGKPAVMNEIAAVRMKQAGYDWDVEWQEEAVQHKGKQWRKCTGCTLWLKRWSAKANEFVPVLNQKTKEPVHESFTEADADHAKIWDKGKEVPLSSKWNFESWGRDMYFWRALGRIRKFHVPDVLRGARMAIDVSDAAEDTAPVALPAPAAEPKRKTLAEQVVEEGKRAQGLLVEDNDDA